MRLAAEEGLQQLIQGLGFRHDDNLPADLGQVRFRVIDDAEEVLDVNHAEAVVEVFFPQGETGVLRFQRHREVCLEVLFGVDRDDLGARRHHIVGGEFAQFEGIDRNFTLCGRDLVGALGLGHQNLQLLGTVDVLQAILVRLDPENHAHQPVGAAIEQADRIAENELEGAQRPAQGQRGI